MHITHSYLGTTRGRFRCLFFLLLEDYIDAQSRFGRDLDQALERFARRMRDSGVLVRPFTGDIEKTRSHVLSKPWQLDELAEIGKTPGLLMIDVDFDTFDPRQHRWLFVHLGGRPESNRFPAGEFAEMSTKLAEAVCDAEVDVFDSVAAAIHDVRLPDVVKVFEAKPGVFGFSVDLIAGAALVHGLWLKLTKGRHVLTATVDQSGWAECPQCHVRFSTKSRGNFDGQRHTTCGTYLNLEGA